MSKIIIIVFRYLYVFSQNTVAIIPEYLFWKVLILQLMALYLIIFYIEEYLKKVLEYNIGMK